MGRQQHRNGDDEDEAKDEDKDGEGEDEDEECHEGKVENKDELLMMRD